METQIYARNIRAAQVPAQRERACDETQTFIKRNRAEQESRITKQAQM